jgi:hypothetical protein
MSITQRLAVGTPLKNGSTLLAWKDVCGYVVVLALNEKNEYVTWDLDADGNTTSGHYFGDLLNAVEDYKTRH